MKKRFFNLCIIVVGMLAFLMYVKEKESTIQDVNAEFHEAKEDDKYENQRSIEWSIEHSEILSEEMLNVLDNEKNCLNSDNASKVVWEEIISSNGETYKVSFERISDLYDAKSESYRYCADYQLIVRNSDEKDISKQIITNFPVWCDDNSQNEYLNLGSLDWDIIDVEFEEGKSSPKYVRQKDCNVEETNADNAIDFYGVWHIDKAVLQSNMYIGTTKDGDFEENLYDPTDYIGMEIEYAPEYFRLGSERYNNPEYILTNRTIKDINDSGKFYNPDIYEFIMDEEIKISDAEKFDCLAEVPLFQVEVEFDKKVSYGDFGFIPVGTQCVILNENTMLIGLWGKILLAHRIKLIKNNLEFSDEMPENEEMFSNIQQCIWGEWKINEMYYGGVGWQECIDNKKGMHIQFLPDSIICNGQATDINMYYNQLLAIEDEEARYFEVKFRDLGFRGDYYVEFEASYVDIEQDVCPFMFFLLVSDSELIILSGKSMYKAEKVSDMEESEPLGFDGLYNTCYGLWKITGSVEQNEGIKSTQYTGEEFLTGRNLDSFVSCRVFSVKNEKLSELVELMDTGNNAYICCYKFSGNYFWDEMIIQDEMTAIVVKDGNLYWAKRKSDPETDGIYNLPF